MFLKNSSKKPANTGNQTNHRHGAWRDTHSPGRHAEKPWVIKWGAVRERWVFPDSENETPLGGFLRKGNPEESGGRSLGCWCNPESKQPSWLLLCSSWSWKMIRSKTHSRDYIKFFQTSECFNLPSLLWIIKASKIVHPSSWKGNLTIGFTIIRFWQHRMAINTWICRFAFQKPGRNTKSSL